MTRVQKKVLGKMANKNSIKFVVDENVAAVLDDFYKWAKVKFFKKFPKFFSKKSQKIGKFFFFKKISKNPKIFFLD